MTAAMLASAAYWSNAPIKMQKWLANRWEAFSVQDSGSAMPVHRKGELWVWLAVAVVAAFSHLLADVVCSIGKVLPVWGVPLFWPFSRTMWAYPLVPWGDVGMTLILVVGMFAMLRWRGQIQWIAAGSLIGVAVYMVVRGTVS